MIGSTVGPFTLVSELGTGGMGTVYLGESVGQEGMPAEAPEERRRVAIKVVHPHLIATPGFFKRFLREAELGKQVQHENVVRTLDVDATIVDKQQVNYMVMEYVEGKSLRELIGDLGTVPEALLREIGLQMAAGVSAIHAEGIVHRDLKPENVLITDDHRIRIMDLGVAKLQEASVALTKEGQFAGSFLYAAPEQFRGGQVGPRSDLYSLGVILYELSTGTNPFKQDDPAAVINAHLNVDPPPAADRSPDLSLFVSEVVRTLIAKDADARVESAESLHKLLDSGEKSVWWTEREKALLKGATKLPQLRVRRKTNVHGRDAELALLRDGWANAKEGQGNTVLLEGEAGIGKTRLIDEFFLGLKNEDCHVLYGSYPPSGGLGGLSEAILGKYGEANLEESLKPYLTVTPALVPAFAALLKHETAPSGSEPLQGDALQAVTCHLMRALAQEKPTVWVLEDIHFAPAESRNLLLAMARAVSSDRLLLITTARPGLPEEDVAHLTRLETLQRHEITRLGAREVIELLKDAFGSESVAIKLGGTIAYKSDGVPFFVFEMMRGLEESGMLTAQPDGTYVQTQVISDIRVPSAVKDLIEARLRDLTKEERAFLDLGAVQGFEFDPDLVARVRGVPKMQALETLADLERRTGIIRGGAGNCRFDQYQIHEVLLEGLIPDLRAEYHTVLADAYAEREDIEEDDAEPEEAVFLTTHYLHGSRPKKARPFLKHALDFLETSNRNEAALDLTTRALEAKRLLKGPDRVQTLLRHAALLGHLGHRDRQRESIDEAVRLAGELDDALLESRAHSALGWACFNSSHWDEAVAEHQRALDLALGVGDRRLEVGGLHGLITTEVQRGHYEQAHERVVAALRICEEIDDRDTEARILAPAGNVMRRLGRYEDARQYYMRHLEIAHSTGNRQSEATATLNLSDVLEFLGKLGEAASYAHRSLAASRELGYRVGETIDLLNLGHMSISLGRAAEGRTHLELAVALTQELGDRRLESYGRAFLAETVTPSEARALLEEAIAIRREINYPAGLADDLVTVARHETENGDVDDAIASLDEALTVANEIDYHGIVLVAAAHRALLPGGDVAAALAALEHEPHSGHQHKMQARFALWKATDDRAHLDEAHRLLVYLRDHAPEEHRESMIENVPLHRAIMEAHGDR